MANSRRNPAADPRSMRRVIAEDENWNLETVPPLVDVCIKHIVNNFYERPILDELKPSHRVKVLKQLSVDTPISITAPLISDESYWERCCKSRWELCDVSDHMHSWKIMYFERNAQEAIEKFVPELSDQTELEELLRLSSPYIQRLVIRQLLPPPQEKSLSFEEDDIDGYKFSYLVALVVIMQPTSGYRMTDSLSFKPCNDHLDCSIILSNLQHLEELQLTYGVLNCGMNFQWNLFEFTSTDCQLLAKALKATPTLKIFRLREAKVNNDRARILIAHLLDHPSMHILDFSHNCLSDGAGRALGKLLNDHAPQLVRLDVSDNQLEEVAGISIGHALQRNSTLRELELSMNRLGDEGAQHILKALMKNQTLVELNISSNIMGEPSAPTLAEMLMANCHLTKLTVTCNKFGEAGGKLLQEGMEDNKTLLYFDLRLTEISQESEYCINQIIKNNLDTLKQEQL